MGLQYALDELSSLIQRVETEQAFSVRYNNPNLKKCYELKNCAKTACPCYGKEALRCWQIAGTHCGGVAQGESAQKYKNCTECDVFREAASTPILQIGEHFNNMMNILDLKNKELEQAYVELSSTQSKILQQEKMASIGQLAAGVAHEINNPMGFISSNLGTLNKYLDRLVEYIGILTEAKTTMDRLATDEALAGARKRLKVDFVLEDTKKLVAESLDGADRVKTIVQNLKSFSRVDQAETIFADVNDCIDSALNIVWNELKYKTTVKKEYGALPQTRCYPQQLNQVFMNLLVNAAHAIDKQGVITLRTWHQDGSVFASVSDTGMGISDNNLSRIFEPFFTTKAVGKGTGLGLSITYDIVKKHKGDITVLSEPGKGSTFTVKIPVVPEN
jgi:two-component system NtrC family sensor kinase